MFVATRHATKIRSSSNVGKLHSKNGVYLFYGFIGGLHMARFTLPRDLYHGKGSLAALKDFKGNRAIICVGGGSMKRFGFLDTITNFPHCFGINSKTFSSR